MYIIIPSDKRPGEQFIFDTSTKSFIGKVYAYNDKPKKIAQAFIDGLLASQAESEYYKYKVKEQVRKQQSTKR